MQQLAPWSRVLVNRSHSATQAIPHLLWNPKVQFEALYNFCNMLVFLRWWVVSLPPDHHTEVLPLFGCSRLHFQCIYCYLPYLGAFYSIRNLRRRHAVVVWTHII